MSGTSWGQLGSDIEGEASGDESGKSVSLNSSGNIVAIGAPYNGGGGTNSGHTRIYQYNSSSTSWGQVGGDIDGEASSNLSGWSVSLNSAGDIVAIGAPFNSGGGTFRGHTRIYQYNSSTTSWDKIVKISMEEVIMIF